MHQNIFLIQQYIFFYTTLCLKTTKCENTMIVVSLASYKVRVASLYWSKERLKRLDNFVEWYMPLKTQKCKLFPFIKSDEISHTVWEMNGLLESYCAQLLRFVINVWSWVKCRNLWNLGKYGNFTSRIMLFLLIIKVGRS